MTKPNSLVVDITSANKPGLAYVMLSRVQSLDQLIILDEMDPERITVNDQVTGPTRISAMRCGLDLCFAIERA